jgi:hypothetical protein
MTASVPVHEQRSKALFGNKHMLDLCTGIAQRDEPFTALDLSTTVGLGYSTTHRLLASLTRAGATGATFKQRARAVVHTSTA